MIKKPTNPNQDTLADHTAKQMINSVIAVAHIEVMSEAVQTLMKNADQEDCLRVALNKLLPVISLAASAGLVAKNEVEKRQAKMNKEKGDD